MPILARPILLFLLLAGFSSALPVRAADDEAALAKRGKAIYRQQCAECHGERGEGVKGSFDGPLVGDRSLVELTGLIAKTMPEGAADECTGADAEAVAKYVFDAFYSRVAQARNRPPRIQLARLTATQYEQAVADLLRPGTGVPRWNEERGLEAEYYADRRFRRDKRVAQRRDAVVDFDFGEGPPVPEAKADAFSIRWRGSVVAPETGDYDFVLRTENGARLTVNGQTVVDAWVRSGKMTEHRGSIRLLGGRAYPLNLEYFSFKEKTASIRLEWKRPHHVLERIPTRALLPRTVSPTFVLTTPFPPDDASEGYERGTSISRAWDEATTRAALEVAEHAIAVSRAKDETPDRDRRLRDLCRRFVDRAFRRPLSDEEAAFWIDRQFERAGDPVTAVRRVVVLALKSPQFLYREPDPVFDDHAVASWLAFTLWDSIPDDRLMTLARAGALRTPEKIRSEVTRMTNDPRAHQKLKSFLIHWLRIEHFPDIDKDDERFPNFDDALVSDLRTSLDLTLDHWLNDSSPRLPRLLTAKTLMANDRIAEFYGLPFPSGDANAADDTTNETEQATDAEASKENAVAATSAPEFRRVSLDGPRVGILSHPYLLAGFAYDAASSPIHRGVFVARSVLGRRLRPPPIAVTPFEADLHPDLTTRQRVQLQTQPSNCSGCHGLINPLGFALESFDAVGRYRQKDGKRPVDATGWYLDRSGRRAEFNGVAELAAYLADNTEVHEAFAEQLFQFSVKQPVQAFGAGRLRTLQESFTRQQGDLRRLSIEIATQSVLHMLETRGPSAARPSTPDTKTDTKTNGEKTSPQPAEKPPTPERDRPR